MKQITIKMHEHWNESMIAIAAGLFLQVFNIGQAGWILIFLGWFNMTGFAKLFNKTFKK